MPVTQRVGKGLQTVSRDRLWRLNWSKQLEVPDIELDIGFAQATALLTLLDDPRLQRPNLPREAAKEATQSAVARAKLLPRRSRRLQRSLARCLTLLAAMCVYVVRSMPHEHG
mmetsp:Transcript_61999/g.164752  ORF Transcript_61999/g.164752 Transcript_61999/m.164752 type:complete len:113 (+) Transcript_61999:392-730(+)